MDIVFIRGIKKSSVLSGLEIGGIELQVLTLAKEISNRKLFNPVLASTGAHTAFAKKFSSIGEVFEYSDNNIFSAANDIHRIIKTRKVALLQSHMFRESIIGRMVKKRNPGIPHIFRAHTYIDSSDIPGYQKTAYHLLDKFTSGYVDKYFANGRYLQREIIEKSMISSSKIECIIDGCAGMGTPDILYSEDDSPMELKIAIVANFIPLKGHHLLVKALSFLKNKGMIIKCRMIGAEDPEKKINPTEYAKFVKAEAERLGVLNQLEFLGFTNDVYGALKNIPVVVLPSYTEGTPNSILEAMSLKKLVVVSEVGGVPEMVKNNVTGFLHPSGDSGALANILEKIFTSPAAQWNAMRNAAYGSWKENFSVDNMLNRFISEYRKLKIIN